ncbi:MAG: type II secretion system protein GspF [Syntrophobacterales bacterium]|nr:MAG: type II secretion system protein GspF [Syntrophobacterales bacterium]
MPVYEYDALSIKGKKLRGIIDAESTLAARQKLREGDLFPIDLRETSSEEKQGAPHRKTVGNPFTRVSQRDISIMTRQLATLLGAGIPLVNSLVSIVSQTVNTQLKKTLAQIKEGVNEGNSLAQSFSRYPRTFSPFYINMIRAGEASGTLDIVLERLADFNENQQALRGRVKAALAYPLFMFLIGSIVLLFLTTFIVPKITTIFNEVHQTLPGITVFLISFSGFLRSFWLILLLIGIAVYAGLSYAIRSTRKGRYLWDTIKIRMPLIGPMIQKMAMARLSQTLATLLRSGVPLLTALSIAKNVAANNLIADAIDEAARDVEEGQNLSTALAKSTLFPPFALQMIAMGEQSGTLEQMLYKIASSYETEVESGIMLMTSMLEPIMILVMGLFVGIIIIAILLPIFEMNQLIR